VADALEYCANELKLPQFQGCEATVEFIKKFDHLFDILNSRNPLAKGYKAPLALAKITILYCYFKTILLLSPLFLCYFIERQPYFNSIIIFLQKKEPYFINVLLYFIPIFIDNRNKIAYFNTIFQSLREKIGLK
jgi:hypothetical protein